MTVAMSCDFLRAFSEVPKGSQKKVREFVERFQQRPDAPGLHFEPIESARDKRLFSVRIDQAYRAVVFHPGSGIFVLTWVDHHDRAYAWAAGRVFAVNPETGALQVLTATEEEAAAEARPAAREPAPAAPAPGRPAGALLARVKDKHLLRLGVPEALLPLVRSFESEDDLERHEDDLPQEAYEALFLIAAGYTVEQVFHEMDKSPEGGVSDPADFGAALANDDSKRRFYVIDEAKDLAELLNTPLAQWRVFLHPKQRRLVEMHANGPVRVLGGAGTGKTVVAMHRAKHLVSKVFTGADDRVLFTTFTRNLATDIYENLRRICSVEELARIDVVNLDAWAGDFLRERGFQPKLMMGDEAERCWENALNVRPANVPLAPAFYRSEWEQVVQAQGLTSIDDYVRAPRLGRGTKLGREVRRRIWPVFQEYRTQLLEQNAREFIDLLRDARQLIEQGRHPLPIRSVVVDEAQDMSTEAFRLIRALVPPGPNDLFIVGDAHQRIYRYKTALAQCGIDIRGRGRKLRLNYRTTDEIRRYAVRLLEGRRIDDLDGGADDQRGYLSLTHGEAPLVKVFGSVADECAFLIQEIRRLVETGSPAEGIVVGARTAHVMEEYERALRQGGLTVYRLRRDAADAAEKAGVRVATLHRVKGLEFDHVFVAGATDGVIPLAKALAEDDDPASREDAETAERALLYVALTRAKKSAVVTAAGEMSRLVVLARAV